MITNRDIRQLNSRKAVAELIEAAYDGDERALMQDLDAAANSLLRTDLKKAEQLAESVGAVRRYLPSALVPRTYGIAGRVHHWRGEFSKALKMYRLAYELFTRNRDYENRARIGRGLMDVHMYLGQHKEAITIGKQSLSYFRRKKLTRDAAMVMTNLGNVHHRLDNNHAALRYYDAARDIFAEEGGVALAIVEYNRANIFANLGQFDRARRLYDSTADLYSKAGLEIAETQARYSLGYLYFLEDRYAEALRTFEQVQDRFDALGDQKSSAVTRLDLAELHLHLNQPGAAALLCDEIIPEFKQLGMRYEEAKATWFAAWARLALNDLAPASKLLTRARHVFKKENNLLWLGMVQMARSRLYLRRRRFKQAQQSAKDALTWFSKSGDTRRRLDAEIARLDAAAGRGRHAETIRRAQALLRSKPVSYQQHDLYHLIGRCHFAQGNYSRALKAFLSAVDRIETMLTGLYSDEIRFFFVLDKYDTYRKTVDCLVQMNRIGEALTWNLKGLQTVNDRFNTRTVDTSTVPPNLLEERDRLRTELKKHNLLYQGSDTTREALPYRAIEQQLWRHEQKIRSYSKASAALSTATATRLDSVREFLSPGETLVSYMRTGDDILAFIVNSDSVRLIQLEVNRQQLNSLLRRMHFLLERSVQDTHTSHSGNAGVRHYLKSVYEALVKPIGPHVNGSRIVLLPDASLTDVPFGLLVDDDGTYLCDRYDIRIAASPEDLTRRRRKTVNFDRRCSAIFAATPEQLPAVGLEGRAISTFFGTATLHEADSANRSSLEKELRRATGFLHIAAHASRSSENPLFSRILLSDGPYFPFDLFRHGVRAELVTLSGCQTAAPGLYYGNSFSLARAFYQAGSCYVLASQWPVSDKLSMVFMVEFYRQLKHTGDIPRAYKTAVSRMRELTGDPALWGGFILLGL